GFRGSRAPPPSRCPVAAGGVKWKGSRGQGCEGLRGTRAGRSTRHVPWALRPSNPRALPRMTPDDNRSCWLDEAPPYAPLPPLRGAAVADVAIIGGGFTGVST